jgi:quinol monooxygenase YgiN
VPGYWKTEKQEVKGMFVLIAKLQAKPGKEKELETELKSVFAKVKDEAGTVSYVLHRAQDNAGKFLFYEKYKDKAALDFHMKTPYLQEMFARIADLTAGKAELEFYEDIESI